MAFDLSSVLNQATEVANQQQSNDESRPRLIYPGTGTLKVKLLFNPKSSTVTRQIKRHKIGNTNYTCLGIYGQDCPICKTVDSIKNVTGQDIWKYNPKTRGLSYVQYVGSSQYTWDSNNPEPKVGEIILLMYPWTIYQDINRIISQAGTEAVRLIATNEGPVVNVIRWRENSQEKYKCEVEPFSPSSFKSAGTDEEFEKLLNDLPNLNEAIIPSEMTQEIYKLSNDAAETLHREYLGNSTYGSMPNTNPTNNVQMGGTPNMITDANGNQYMLVNGQYVPIAPSVSPVQNSAGAVNPNYTVTTASTAVTTPPVNNEVQNQPIQQVQPAVSAGVTSADGSSMPECFGSHTDNNPKCMACLNEIQCMTCAN